MAKKKTKLSLKPLLEVLAALLGVVAICLMAAPAAGIADTKTAFSGAQLTFGYSEGKAVIFSFSFLNFLPYLLTLAGIIFSILTVLGKLGKIAPVISSACYLAAGVLFFLVIVCSVLGEGFEVVLGLGSLITGKGSGKELLSLGAGAIVSGILGILSAGLSAGALVVKK